jgi:uncharacterized protein YbjT (DUF2867 family)
MGLKYLFTGATGGLGSRVPAYLVANVSRPEYAAISSQEANRVLFEKDGIAFRVANNGDPTTLDTVLGDVENLFFVSTENFDAAGRICRTIALSTAKRLNMYAFLHLLLRYLL